MEDIGLGGGRRGYRRALRGLHILAAPIDALISPFLSLYNRETDTYLSPYNRAIPLRAFLSLCLALYKVTFNLPARDWRV